MTLTGIQAFEARWLDLRQDHPTTREENTLIAHAMGQLVDAYKPPQVILQELPDRLVPLFEALAKAYFNGYAPSPPEPYPITTLEVGEANLDLPDGSTQEIAAAIARLKAIANNLHQQSPGRWNLTPGEAETLIVDFPDRPDSPW